MSKGAFLKLSRPGLALFFIAQLIFINYLLSGQQAGGENVQVNEVVRARIGSGAEDLGVVTPQEANPEGPMSFAVSHAGEIYVLDQLNSRIQVFKDGRWLRSIPIPGETYCDLEIMSDGRIALLDNLIRQEVIMINSRGQAEEKISLRRPEIAEPAAVTGIYCRSEGLWPGLWAEAENRFILLTGLDGKPAAEVKVLPGLLTPSGRRLLKIEMAGEKQVRLFCSEEDFQTWRSYDISFGLPVGIIYGPWKDRAGNLYLAANIFDVQDEDNEMVVLDPSGQERNRIKMALSSGIHEVLKPVLVTPDGLIYQMAIEPEKNLVVIRQYRID
ncbi:MAG: hypothetical protein QME85_00020 [Candidatus Saccharicenans sp.]|nr:hypothetical protein [Candidatus Saccharicenans sp.]